MMYMKGGDYMYYLSMQDCEEFIDDYLYYCGRSEDNISMCDNESKKDPGKGDGLRHPLKLLTSRQNLRR